MRLRLTEAIKRAERPRASFTTVDALLAETNRRLAALTEAEVARIAPIIEDALRGVTERLATGKGAFTAHDAKVMRLQLLKAKAALTERLAVQLSRSDTRMQFESIADMRHEVAAMSHHFGKPRALDIDTVLAVSDTSKLLVTRVAKAAAKRSRETINATASVLASAKAQGLSFRDAGRLVAERLGIEGYKGERLARTEYVHAYNLQRAEVAEAEDYGLLWNAASYRACGICGPLDDQRRATGKAFAVVNGRAVHFPPAHPQCRCAAVLHRPEWDRKKTKEWIA